VQTVLVTCTKGECGEIVDPNVDEETKQSMFPRLGEIREEELKQAVAALGIQELRFLGFRDSGMAGTADNNNPECFHQANFDEAVKRLVKLIREFRPQVIATYNAWGGYGHPDHIQAHRVTVAAFGAAGDSRLYPDLGLEVWQPAKLYYTTFPRSIFKQVAETARAMGLDGPWSNPELDTNSMGDSDEVITTVFDTRPFFPQKKAAFGAHRTQISPDSFWFKLPDEILKEGLGFESFTLAQGQLCKTGSNGKELDLFGGLR
jgi:N-acetyl-1-D-myo-inositol-2-amino-2-deoxy-alpha-D-glucopyranoside deacetylase